ncbi:hypothetical protein LL037_25255 (plasmid) [Clostridium estertheticum]|uniref:Uncharacterized protein n=1 Tax=Clostridium estertheticum TaxID=238834 RepID=A0AA47EPN8_9CLOT|nr:hypothetical protein [Clostridium estertheticum]MBU3157612.1 hypothetical protein [Clostridium estertheticum]MBU3201814.1 hypothetical protein [Clostridium estertheticum]WAG63229.1 hypothetical protein LL038_25150 [Clostridium estertheticum]WAG68207.1 hypothetical protein LL037_25255 [Clostridium estertheticum]
MAKLKMFQSDMARRNKIYSVMSDDTSPMAMIDFAILPTKNTKKLFEMIWSKYDKDTHCSILNNEEMVIDNFYAELNIINGMIFQVYTVSNFENDYAEIYIKYPIIIKISKLSFDIKIEFHNRFKEFFDKFLEI